MSMQYIRDYYGVPAKRGMSVRWNGRYGIITGSWHADLRILLEGDKHSSNYPPTGLEYLKNGSVIWPKEG